MSTGRSLAHWLLAGARFRPGTSQTRSSATYGSYHRTSSRIAFAVSWLIFAVTVVVAYRKVLAVPNGQGDITGLTVATVCGAAGLALLMMWLQ